MGFWGESSTAAQFKKTEYLTPFGSDFARFLSHLKETKSFTQLKNQIALHFHPPLFKIKSKTCLNACIFGIIFLSDLAKTRG